AALFPADQPQLVLVVKIDNPHKGSYFAAQTAAPVTRSMLEQALAARTVALDRARLSTAAPRAAAAPVDDDGGLVPYVVPWPYQPDSAGVGPRRAVPDAGAVGLIGPGDHVGHQAAIVIHGCRRGAGRGGG